MPHAFLGDVGCERRQHGPKSEFQRACESSAKGVVFNWVYGQRTSE